MRAKIQEVQQSIQKLGVVALYLFGSRSDGTNTQGSDYDYAVLMNDTGYTRGDVVYQRLYELLADISPRTLNNDVIDIVFLRDASLELQQHVIQHGELLYDHDPLQRTTFEAQVTLRYCDYRSLLDEFDKTIVDSL
jgi:predicted nucleotidyltransferase